MDPVHGSPTASTTSERPVWLPIAPYVFVGLWSLGYVMAVVGQTSAGPITLLALRYLVCIALLAPLVPMLAVRFPTDWRSIGLIALNGFLIHVVYFGASWVALDRGLPVAIVALILSLQPVLVAALAPFLSGQRVRLTVWLGLLLGLVGAAIVILSRSEIGAVSAGTFVLVVVALFGFTLATLLDRRFGGRQHPVAVNLLQFLLAVLFTVPGAAFLEGFRFTVDAALVGAVAYLAIGSSLIGLSLFLLMIRLGEAARVSSLLYLIPPFAALFAWLILSQPLPPSLWIGMAITCAGVYLAVSQRSLPFMRPRP